jgi:uncharacterized protein YjbJ (UPF0337 family)
MVIESLCRQSVRGVVLRGNGNVAQATWGVGLVTRVRGIYSAQAPRDGRREILVRHPEGIYMTEHSKAEDARKGLIDSVKGKAKEVVGAIIKNDSLTAEGQLEQAQARERKEASSAEALADAEARQARVEVTNAKLESVDARAGADARTVAVKSAAETEKSARKRTAEQTAQRAAARGSVQAEADAHRQVQQASAQEQAQVRAADEEVSDALDDHQAAVADAAKARAKADRLRGQAEDLPSDADRSW